MMAITGVCLVLFVTFHVLMNSVAIFWPAAYNSICEFLGANWYALVASMGLAVLFIIHILYALWLTFQNRAARGTDRYAVTAAQPQVEWSSKNMLVLGIVVVAFLGVHLIQFWYKMQYQELLHADLSALPQLDGAPVQPALGTLFLQIAFSEIWTPIVYLIGFVALWFHMNHGFWSMFQTIGWSNNNWLPRLKCISKAWTTIVIALFVIQVGVFTWRANDNYYSTNPELKKQYAESWNKQAKAVYEELQADIAEAFASFQSMDMEKMNIQEQMKMQEQMKEVEQQLISTKGKAFVDKMTIIETAFEKQCSGVAPSQEYQQAMQMKAQLAVMLEQMATPLTDVKQK